VEVRRPAKLGYLDRVTVDGTDFERDPDTLVVCNTGGMPFRLRGPVEPRTRS
jgi:hypothetical protein